MHNGRGCGGKKVNRINLSLDNKTTVKLSKLSTACSMPKTTLAATILTMCLDDPIMVNKLQKEYNKHAAHKVMPINVNGEIKYMFRG